MARRNENVNPEVEENKVEETTEVVEEKVAEEVVTSTGETEKELEGESVANPEVEDAKTEENASKTEEDEEVQVKDEITVANTSFNDKYTGVKYEKGTEFVVVDEEIETEKVSEKKYKISAKRAKEIKAKGYID